MEVNLDAGISVFYILLELPNLEPNFPSKSSVISEKNLFLWDVAPGMKAAPPESAVVHQSQFGYFIEGSPLVVNTPRQG